MRKGAYRAVRWCKGCRGCKGAAKGLQRGCGLGGARPGASGLAGLDLLAGSRVDAVGIRVEVVPSVFGG